MSKKKKILIYADRPGWAYDHILQYVIQNFSHQYEFYYDYTCLHLFTRNTNRLHNLGKDLVSIMRFLWRFIRGRKTTRVSWHFIFKSNLYFFWENTFVYNDKSFSRKVMPYYKKYDLVIMLGYYFDKHANLFYKSHKLVRGIYTEGFPPMGCKYDFVNKINPLNIDSIETFAKLYLNNIDGLLVGCPSLIQRYDQFVSNIHFCNAIYKPEIFNEKKLVKKQVGDTIVIGWTGNPQREFKNFYTIVEKVVNELARQNYPVRLKARFSGSYESLPDFYNDVDLVLIASTKDAGPSMFAEASLCGIPGVSNKIGFPEFVIQDGVNGFLVDLNIEQYLEKVKLLIENPDLLYSMSKLSRAYFLNKLGDERLLASWDGFFNDLLE